MAQADEGTLQQTDLEGGSISISNLGMYGVDDFSAIINPPQSAILAVGAGRPTAVAVGRKVRVRTAVELVLSVDHRAIDGALAAQWMTALVDAVHRPLHLSRRPSLPCCGREDEEVVAGNADASRLVRFAESGADRARQERRLP